LLITKNIVLGAVQNNDHYMPDFIYLPRRVAFIASLILIAFSVIGVGSLLVMGLFWGTSVGPGFKWTAIASILSMDLLLLLMSIATLIENELRRRDGRKTFLGMSRTGSWANESYLGSQLFAILYLGLGVWMLSWFLPARLFL
jgi:hypothetical protein